MKKIFIKLLLVLSLFIFPWDTFAAGGYTVSRTSLNLTKGGSGTITISVTNAAGRINISSSNSAVATVSKSSQFVDAYDTTTNYTFTITGKSVGNAIVTVSAYDMATYNKEVITSSYKINVNVKAPSTPSTPKPSSGGSTPTPSDGKSSNTNLSKLTIDGKNITKNNNTYTLEVSNYVEKVNIAATAADSKSKVTGTGSKNLNVGKNTFDVVVTAENGNKTTYKVIITRKEYNVLSELDELLKQNKDIEIKLSEGDKLNKEELDKIITSNVKVTLNKFSEDNKVLYSWILNGAEIKGDKTFDPSISTIIEDNSDMEEALNYADGIYLDFSNCKDIPEGAILKYYVADKYNDKDKINLYIYDEETGKITKLESDITPQDGYIQLKISDSVKHFISKAKVINATISDNNEESNSNSNINIWFIISMILIVIVFIGLICIIVNKKKEKTSEQTITPSAQSEITPSASDTVTIPPVASEPEVMNATIAPIPATPIDNKAPEIINEEKSDPQAQNADVL